MHTEPVLPDFTDAPYPQPLWVFGYGSLIWQPDFPVAEMRLARAAGWSRSFCMWSIHHRGTVEHPGLVLAMDRAEGRFCDGVVLRAAPGSEAETLAMLRERELVSSAYLETWLDLELRDAPGTRITALAYVMDRSHVQYTGELSFDEQAAIIARAVGGRGPNRDYLYATSTKLAELGIEDADLTRLAGQVRNLDN